MKKLGKDFIRKFKPKNKENHNSITNMISSGVTKQERSHFVLICKVPSTMAMKAINNHMPNNTEKNANPLSEVQGK